MLSMRTCARRTSLNTRLTVALAIAFGVITFATANLRSTSLKPSVSSNSALPIPLCEPTDPTCGPGGTGGGPR